MNFNEYLQTVKFRCKNFPFEQQPDHARIGMVGEVGEMADAVKKRFVGKPFDNTNFMEECGDYLWYYVLESHVANVPMFVLDDAADAANKAMADAVANGCPLMTDADVFQAVVKDLPYWTAILVRNENPMDVHEARRQCFALIAGLLYTYGFTIEQCLIANDAKLALRTKKPFPTDGRVIQWGEAWNVDNSINRDTAAERVVLDAHAQNVQQGAG